MIDTVKFALPNLQSGFSQNNKKTVTIYRLSNHNFSESLNKDFEKWDIKSKCITLISE